MITKTVQITEVSIDELADKVADKLLVKIQGYLDDLNTKENDVYLTRKETAEFLKINLTTLWNWTNKGRIISYGLGHRIYY
jgi:hypothetical protein